MTAPDLIGLFVQPLESIGASYMITGGVASVIYGDPRFTRDVDIVLELPPPEVGSLASAFEAPEFYVPSTDTLKEEAARPEGGHFNIIHGETALRADVYLTGDDPLTAWAFERRARMSVDDGEIWVAPIEYVILRKLEYYEHSRSDRHLRDVAMMLRISGEAVDADALHGWSERLGMRDALERARGYSPE